MQTITGARGDGISRDQAFAIGKPRVLKRVSGKPCKKGALLLCQQAWNIYPIVFRRLFCDKNAPQDDLVDNHVYVVDGVRFDQNDEAVVRLRNPWQRNNSSLVNENILVDSSDSFVELRMRNMMGGRGLNILIWG